MILKERFQNLAFRYFNNREFDKALKLVDRLLEEDKDNFDLLLFKGDIHAEIEEIESAQNYYISALEKANKEKDHFKRLLALMKLRRIQGETNDLNSRIFVSAYNLGILKLCKDAISKLLREDVLGDSQKFIERVIKEIKGEDSPITNFLLGILYIKLEKEEGIKLLNLALDKIEEDEKLKNYKEFIEKFTISGSGVSIEELENILEIEGLSEKKLEPAGTLELADLLKSIGSHEEALLEYYSAIYGYLKAESNIEKAKEILEKIKEMAPEDERIPKVEEFLERFEGTPEESGTEKPEIKADVILKIYNDFLLPEENTENYIKFLNMMAEWNMFEEVIENYKEIEEKVEVDLFAPYYLYVLFMIGEFEEVISKADRYAEETESEETLKFIKYFKALSLYRLDNKEEALEIFGAIYEQDPGFLDVKEYIEVKRPEEIAVSESVLEEEVEEEVEAEEIQEIEAEEVEKAEVQEIEEVQVDEEVPAEEKTEEIVPEKETVVQKDRGEFYKKPINEHFVIM